MTGLTLVPLGADHEVAPASAEGSTAVLARQLLQAVADTPTAELPALVGILAGAQAAALARLTMPAPAGAAPEAVRYLGLEEAERLTGQSRRWLLRHTRGLRFRRDLSRKAVRFEEAGLLRWLRGRA